MMSKVVPPEDSLAFFDVVRVWLRRPVQRTELHWLKAQAGKGGLYYAIRRARFDPTFVCVLELRQPSSAALDWMASHPGALVNKVEISMDLVFSTIEQREAALEFFDRHLVRRCCSSRERVTMFGSTRYDGLVGRNKLVCYPERRSRVSGGRYVLHLEWRAVGARAVRSVGISLPADLVHFDHHAFWCQRLVLIDIDPARLGRALSNKRESSRRKAFRFVGKDGKRTNLDAREGLAVVASFTNMQDLIRTYRRQIRLDRVINRIPNAAWLPKR
jgi:hypothetical protein